MTHGFIAVAIRFIGPYKIASRLGVEGHGRRYIYQVYDSVITENHISMETLWQLKLCFSALECRCQVQGHVTHNHHKKQIETGLTKISLDQIR